MVVFGLKIEKAIALKKNQLALIFLMMGIGSFGNAIYKSGYFSEYRFGDSIVPKESQLVRYGPYVMRSVKTPPHHADLIKFRSLTTGEEYSEQNNNFNRTVDILDLVKENENKPVAYLWLYFDNPLRKIWKIDVGTQTVFSYERASFIYHVDVNPTFSLELSALSFLMFFLSAFRVTRIKNLLNKNKD